MITEARRAKTKAELEAARVKIRKLTGLGPFTFAIFWKFLKKLLPWLIELIILSDDAKGTDGEIIVPEPYLSSED